MPTVRTIRDCPDAHTARCRHRAIATQVAEATMVSSQPARLASPQGIGHNSIDREEFARNGWYPCNVCRERWLSGRKRRFAKPVRASRPSAGSNPVLSASVLFKEFASHCISPPELAQVEQGLCIRPRADDLLAYTGTVNFQRPRRRRTPHWCRGPFVRRSIVSHRRKPASKKCRRVSLPASQRKQPFPACAAFRRRRRWR